MENGPWFDFMRVWMYPNGTLYRRYVPGPGTDVTVVWYDSANTTAQWWLMTDLPRFGDANPPVYVWL